MTDGGETISPTLLERVRARDEPAWARMVTLFAPLVRGWARRGGVAEADVDDVVQEVFLKVSRALAGFRRDKPTDTFLGWLRVLTRHRVAEYHAARGEQGAGGTQARERFELHPDAGDEELDESSRAAIVRETLSILRPEFAPRTWDAFEATALEGQPPESVADRLGMTVGAVYVAKSRVLRRLKQELQDLMDA